MMSWERDGGVVDSYQLSVIGYQYSVISDQLSVASYQLSVVGEIIKFETSSLLEPGS